jgi:DNA-binding transcriptional MerR regulator
MTIQELARRANVTPRTIRYYVEQGILPPPGRGRPSEYTDEHLKVLDLVRRLKEQYLPLEEIRSMLQSLSMEQVQDFLRQTTPRTQPVGEPAGSAAEYISHVLNRGNMRSRLQQEAAPAPPAQLPRIAEPAPSYEPAPGQAPQRYFDEAAAAPAVARPSAPAGPAQPPISAPAPASTPWSGEKEKTAAREASVENVETWQRVQLAPGIELHYQAPEDLRQRGLVARIVQAARQIIGQE